MKYFVSILVFFFTKNTFGQSCKCESDSTLSEMINCDSVKFSNKSILFRNFNCDSSWLTFQNKYGKEIVLYSLQSDLIKLTERLGYQYATEFSSTFLIQNNVISGCCDPPEYILFDKYSGKELVNFGRIIYYSDVQKLPIIVFFENSNYKNISHESFNYNVIIVRNVENKKTYKIFLPKNRIDNTIKLSGELFAEHLIDNVEIINNELIINYRYQIKAKQNQWQTSTVKFKLK